MSTAEKSLEQKAGIEAKAAKLVLFLNARRNRKIIIDRIVERMVAETHRLVEAAVRELLSARGAPNAFVGVSEQVPGAHAFPVDENDGDDPKTSESSEDSAGDNSGTSESPGGDVGDDSDPSSSESEGANNHALYPGSEPPQG